MPADLSRDPDELDRIAHLLRDLAAGLSAEGLRTARDRDPAAGRIADELDAVATALARAAATGRAADAAAAAALREVTPGTAGPGPPAAGPAGVTRSSPGNPLTR